MLSVLEHWLLSNDAVSNNEVSPQNTAHDPKPRREYITIGYEPDDPQDAVVAKQYEDNPELYRKTARHWSQKYADGELTHIRTYTCIIIFYLNKKLITFNRIHSRMNISFTYSERAHRDCLLYVKHLKNFDKTPKVIIIMVCRA